jgi:hypothetical protein
LVSVCAIMQARRADGLPILDQSNRSLGFLM